MTQTVAVLTGDLIASTRAPVAAVSASMALIAQISARIGTTTRFTRYRGDGWQIYLDDPGRGLWAMLLIAASLRAAGLPESRIALGLGAAHGGSADSLVTAGGEAFTASGRALDALAPPARLALAGAGVDRLHQRLVAFLEERAEGWSREQAEAVALALEPEEQPTQAQIAARLGITRQAVAARLQAAGFANIKAAEQDFHHVFHREEARDA
jgi:biotin operon repressor